MPLPSYDSLLETTAVITTILSFLSGMIICRKYISKKSTGESSGLPFVSGFLSCSFWLRYGTLSNESSVMLVNVIGASLFLGYTLVYYIFTVQKSAYLKQFFAALAVLLLVIVYTNNIEEDTKARQTMGVICCIVTVCYIAAPLTNLLHVIRVRNSESLPLPLIAMGFLVSVQWLIYGVLISDTYIQITNFLGCLLSMMQLSLFVCFPPKSAAGPSYKLLDQSAIF